MEAKGEGFDVKILREVVRLRRQDKNERDERESLLDVYMHALETGDVARHSPQFRRATCNRADDGARRNDAVFDKTPECNRELAS